MNIIIYIILIIILNMSDLSLSGSDKYVIPTVLESGKHALLISFFFP
jgi:hypothetical protein